MNRRLLFLFFIYMLFFSCKTAKKEITYEDKKISTSYKISIENKNHTVDVISGATKKDRQENISTVYEVIDILNFKISDDDLFVVEADNLFNNRPNIFSFSITQNGLGKLLDNKKIKFLDTGYFQGYSSLAREDGYSINDSIFFPIIVSQNEMNISFLFCGTDFTLGNYSIKSIKKYSISKHKKELVKLLSVSKDKNSEFRNFYYSIFNFLEKFYEKYDKLYQVNGNLNIYGLNKTFNN